MGRQSFIIIIPARYGSSRFPGKPLADMKGKPMIQRVVEQARHLGGRVVVATDNEAIYDCVESFGGEVVMTSEHHNSGTERCIEAFEKVGNGEDILLNLQGDEPFIQIAEIQNLLDLFDKPSIMIGTLAEVFDASTPDKELADSNKVKLVLNQKNEAMYFSRSVIPFIRDCQSENLCASYEYLKHVGIYAFRTSIISKLKLLPNSQLEALEKLEQLKWLEAGYTIGVIKTYEQSIGIDTSEDLQNACKLLD